MRSTNELIEASDHLQYEIWMLRIASFELESHAKTINDPKNPEPVSYTHTNFSESIYSSSAPFTPPSKSEGQTAQINAYVESFAIHLRSLLDFFYSDSQQAHKEDVLAEHYFKDPSYWNNNRPKLSDTEISRIKGRIGTEIAHLSYKRILLSDADKLWPFIKLKMYVLNALDVFIDHVDRKLLSNSWNEKTSYR